MKKRKLETFLKKMGFYLKRHGARHDYWSNDFLNISVPRHNEIAEGTSKEIMKKARQGKALADKSNSES